jgi:hypothetical protein
VDGIFEFPPEGVVVVAPLIRLDLLLGWQWAARAEGPIQTPGRIELTQKAVVPQRIRRATVDAGSASSDECCRKVLGVELSELVDDTGCFHMEERLNKAVTLRGSELR